MVDGVDKAHLVWWVRGYTEYHDIAHFDRGAVYYQWEAGWRWWETMVVSDMRYSKRRDAQRGGRRWLKKHCSNCELVYCPEMKL